MVNSEHGFPNVKCYQNHYNEFTVAVATTIYENSVRCIVQL